MKFDLHTHHKRCGHAIGEIQEYIEVAIQRGFSVIGISDHSPYFASSNDHERPTIAMAISEFEHYVQEVLHLKEQYRNRIDVLLGVESDYFPEHAQLYRQVYEKYPFDYRIGSVHWSSGSMIFDRARWEGVTPQDLVRQKDDYYRLIAQSAQSGMFQILGHIDALKGYYPPFSDVESDQLDMALKAIAESGVAIEVNTSGKTKDCGGWYPSDSILERAHHYGVIVSFGSDAHDPNRVGDDWELVQQKLKEIGYTSWVYYKQLEPHIVPL